MPQPIANRLVLLDGMRGLAALMVVLYHANLDGSAPAFARAYLMVDLFFLLSGFVVTLGYEPHFHRELTAGHFVGLRWRRFRPMVIAGALLGAMANVSAYPPLMLLGVTIAACLMLPQGIGEPMYQTNASQWSLLNELFANSAHAAVLHRLNCKELILVAVACGIGLTPFVFAIGNANLGASVATLVPGLLRTGWSYIVGVLMARAWRNGVRPISLDWRLTLVMPCLAVLILPTLPIPVWLGDLLMVNAVLPSFFWLSLGSRPPTSAAHWLIFLGGMSFPLYALHIPILALWKQYFFPQMGRASGVPLALVIAAMAGTLFERRRHRGTERNAIII